MRQLARHCNFYNCITILFISLFLWYINIRLFFTYLGILMNPCFAKTKVKFLTDKFFGEALLSAEWCPDEELISNPVITIKKLHKIKWNEASDNYTQIVIEEDSLSPEEFYFLEEEILDQADGFWEISTIQIDECDEYKKGAKYE